MATQTALTIRRDEAFRRIERAVAKLANDKKTATDVLAVHHRDPFIEQVMRIEAVADSIEKLAKGADPAEDVEQQLEAETGHDVVQTGDEPPTYVETDKPAPKGRSRR
jgi:hypothetical protein